MKSSEIIIFFTVLTFLFIGAGVSTAQIDGLSLDTTLSNVDEKEVNIIDSDIVLPEETYVVPDIVEELLNEPDENETFDGTIVNEEKNILPIPPRKKEAIRERVEERRNNTVEIPKDVFREQSKELLRILQEKNREKIEEIKRKKTEKARAFKERTAQEEKLKDIDIDTKSDEEGIGIGIDLEEIEKEVIGIEKTGEVTKKEAQRFKEVVFEKKRKIIKRARDRRTLKETNKDSDKDGVSDYDEVNIYGTDPFSADSDSDGYVDGAEILIGFDPLSKSLDALIEYENPKEVGVLEDDIFSVGKIEVVETIIVKNVNTEKEVVSKILFEGRALPNAFITLYIFSNPTIVTVKTNKDGNWEYTLDKELEDGKHEIYVAMTDSKGSILAKSSPIPFVKQASAVTVDEGLLSFDLNIDQPGFWSGGYLYIAILLTVFFSGIILVVIGIRLRVVETQDGEFM